MSEASHGKSTTLGNDNSELNLTQERSLSHIEPKGIDQFEEDGEEGSVIRSLADSF